MKGRFLVPPAMRTGYKVPRNDKTLRDDVKDVGKGIGNGFKNNFNPKEPIFMKDAAEGRNINNLWTGYKLGGKGKILTTASLLGGGTVIASNPRNLQNHYNTGVTTESQSQEQDVESMQSTRGDGVGYNASIATNAMQNLSTSGDLVFAMHKTRHSGQL